MQHNVQDNMQNNMHSNMDMGQRYSFWKGVALGFCLTVIVAVLGASIFMLAREKSQIAQSKKEKMTTAEDVVVNEGVQEKLEKIAKLIDEQYFEELDIEQLETYLYKGLVAGTEDLYSSYYSEEEMQRFMEDTSGSYSGIGVTMQYDSTMGMVRIVSVNPKGPASKVDIQEDDYIYQVDGEQIPLENADTSELVSHIRGEEGTKVKLTLLRGDDREEVEVEVTRQNVEVETVTSQMLEDNIGYIKISEFEGMTVQQFDAAYKQVQEDGAKALIIDLRANPGGQVNSVVDIAGNFCPEGLVTYMEDKNGRRQEYSCSGENVWDKPLVVLIDGNSASASEIFAGAIRDYEAGTLMGTKSFGKGIVQQTISLGDGTALKLTFAKYYTPNGENIHKKGIEPDIEVEYEKPAEDEEYSVETDNQVLAAIKELKKQMSGQ